MSPALQADSLPSQSSGKPLKKDNTLINDRLIYSSPVAREGAYYTVMQLFESKVVKR